jgi:glutamyl-tRNA reductase
MQLYVIGVNHTTAPVQIREHVAFNSEQMGFALRELTQSDATEAAILSTCNRTELYCSTDNPQKPLAWLSQYHKIESSAIQPYIYTLPDGEAVKHAFRVASGLDSMVLGEAQILGQFKQSVKLAQEAGTLGTLLHKLFQRTFEVAKEVRTNTDIGANSVSMSAASVKLAQRIFGDIRQQKILFIGAGEMITLCADHFAAQKPKVMTVANRTLARGQLLADKIGGEAILLTEIPDRFHEYDIVVSCTASQLPMIGLGMVEKAIKLRRHRPMFMVDLAVPRDIETEVAELDDVFLYTVDDLAQVVTEGLSNRQEAAMNAETIVIARVQNFMDWFKKRNAVPTIKAIRDQADAIRQAELVKALKLMQKGEAPEKVLEIFSQALTNKFLHVPSHALSKAEGEAHEQLEAMLKNLYQIKD